MNTLTIGITQLNTAWENPNANKTRIEDILSSAQEPLDLLVLPEMFLTGFSCAESSSVVTTEVITEWMADLAQRKNVAIMGSVKVREVDNSLRNRLILQAPDGSIQTYDKRHLFPISEEGKNFTAGSTKKIFSYKNWKICPQICYDLRFPVWSRNVEEYDLLINVANWPQSRRTAWTTLLKARAIENQCYTIGVNRIGTDDMGLKYSGDSLVIDMLGETIVDASSKPDLLITKLDKNVLLETRRNFPFLKDMDSFILKENHA